VRANLPAFRIGTWNLDRPSRNHPGLDDERLRLLSSFEADVWILTETTRDFRIPSYESVFSRRPELVTYSDNEAYASIHSRWPLRPVAFEPFDPCFAVCAEIERKDRPPLIVYASIITYHFDGVREGKAPWELHQLSCEAHGRDWLALAKQLPEHGLIVGGDFNQALDGVGRYRNARSTTMLNAAINDAGLQLLTGQDYARAGQLRSRHSVDHIAVGKRLVASAGFESAAFEGELEGRALSDHNGVVVSLPEVS
jgi:hypothetical protein